MKIKLGKIILAPDLEPIGRKQALGDRMAGDLEPGRHAESWSKSTMMRTPLAVSYKTIMA